MFDLRTLFVNETTSIEGLPKPFLRSIRQPMSRSQSELSITEAERALLQSTFPRGLVVFDLETSGLSPLVNKIIEIAAVKLDKMESSLPSINW